MSLAQVDVDDPDGPRAMPWMTARQALNASGAGDAASPAVSPLLH
ncbi:hypothetical protein [Actinomadura sp. KC06]|nr:hypothetical protein [Actinomadura sp. KC06]